MRILITGAAGFIGSRLAEWILSTYPHAKVFGVDNFASGFKENVPAGVRFEYCDLANYASRVCYGCNGGKWRGNSEWMETCPICDGNGANSFDYVFHCAAFAAEVLSPFVREHTYRNNLVGSAALLNNVLATGCKRLVFLSSVAVYGHVDPPFRECDPCFPIDPYGISKAAFEMDLNNAGEQHGLDWCALRLFNVYGPGQSLWNQHRNVFGIWMRQKLEGKPLTVFGDGSCERAFTYIDDILPAIWNAGINPAASRQVINVGSPLPVYINSALTECMSVIGKSEVEYKEGRHEVRSAYCDVSKSQALLKAQTPTNLRDGLTAMWEWAQETWSKYPERRSHKGPPIELRSR